MRITLRNIQSIKEAVYDFPEEGITQIIGDNSNGKSIVRKAISFIALCKISDQDERDPIINDLSEFGEIMMERAGKVLYAYIHRDRNNCFYVLQREDGEKISRTIREGGLDKLVAEFGFATYDKNHVLLQVLKVNSVMPFISDRPSLDYEIVESIVTDRTANAFLENYEKVTFPALRNHISTLRYNIEHFNGILGRLPNYDIDREVYNKNILEDLYYNIGESFTYTPEMLPIMEELQYVDVTPIKLKEIPVFQILPDEILLDSLYKDISDLLLASTGVCPLCKGSLENCDDYDLVFRK